MVSGAPDDKRSRLAGQGLGGGGSKGFGSGGGVGGRGTGPSDGANFATCEWRFLKDALWGGEGYPPELAWWTGGVDQGPCLAVPQEGARARGGIQGLRFRKGRCVIFRQLKG